MEVQYAYQKKRSEFGRQCLFSDRGPELIDNFPSDKQLHKNFLLRDPVSRSTQCAPIQAEHYLNTMRAEFTNSSMNHVEGGWPKDVNTADEEQTKRYRRKIEKDEGYYHTMMQLFKNMENCILQNNAINIYQQYFSDVEPTTLVERSSARTVNLYQDQCNPTRPITHISWSPDNQTKLAVSHCNLIFQPKGQRDSTFSYIWEVENPNRPLIILKPEYSVVCLEYNQKDPHSLVSGQINGQVALWDTRKSYEPVELSVIESSFRDPVHNVLWIHSKTGTEFFSSSTDGQVKWWDIRKLSEPTETLILDNNKEEDQKISNAFGASCLEYENTIPTRFMVGTEQGVVISCNRKGKTALEKMTTRFSAHMGPVLALQRNPGFVKNFLTIGDWSAKIWSEDCRESAIMWTSFHKAMLTDGSWSPTRLSVFFTTRSDGTLDVWDILQQQKQASLSVKVADEPLKCLRTHDMGRLVAVGNQKGSIYLVEFSENLSVCNKNDKMLLTAMFERESRREKILEARNRELRLKLKQTKQAADNVDEDVAEEEVETVAEGVFQDNFVQQAETEFYQTIEKALAASKPPPEVPPTPTEPEVIPQLEPQPEPEPQPPPAPEPELPSDPPVKEKKGKKKK
ncbi:dynein intermediate chain 3, ciliary-like [Anoplophora glabripennis]|uniref:dynein intermediate chain 3, ciliary-like n=1 Tax=Anoplophora glabripennis TaxID=217634 RepID=UPI0008736543|nr:dynein intermediate chain 3, ciliary-like [Anoplophora glabripennis]